MLKFEHSPKFHVSLIVLAVLCSAEVKAAASSSSSSLTRRNGGSPGVGEMSLEEIKVGLQSWDCHEEQAARSSLKRSLIEQVFSCDHERNERLKLLNELALGYSISGDRRDFFSPLTEAKDPRVVAYAQKFVEEEEQSQEGSFKAIECILATGAGVSAAFVISALALGV